MRFESLSHYTQYFDYYSGSLLLFTYSWVAKNTYSYLTVIKRSITIFIDNRDELLTQFYELICELQLTNWNGSWNCNSLKIFGLNWNGNWIFWKKLQFTLDSPSIRLLFLNKIEFRKKFQTFFLFNKHNFWKNNSFPQSVF